MGVSTDYNQETAVKICTWIAEGKSLVSFCKQEDTPHISTVYRWIASNEVFRETYTQARADQADTLADQILDIADDKSNDVSVGPDGITKPNPENVQRSKLRVEARKWAAAKLKPVKYGDKIDVTSDNERIESVNVTRTVINGRKDG